ncbi:MAG: M23 family metallopeptidase [Desulfobulbaceae bacterium]|nr:M23 family metallopeptidase [Desulfobulbaceae bacterium]
MQDKLFVVFTSELGKTRSFAISKTRLKRIFCVSAVLVAVFSVFSIAGVKYSYQNVDLRVKANTLQQDLDHTRTDYEKFQQKVATQEAAKESMLQTALTELKKRSKIIESILDTVGVDFQIEEGSANTGGPYTDISDNSYENLTFKVDHYLETIQSIPLGAPTAGRITSSFGKRIDPINSRPAFHEGVDIKNAFNSPVKATADGVVFKSGFGNGFGNYVVVNHGNGFMTRYFHLCKRAVKRGTTVKRGQIIGYLGSTGRSTGPHLHYEIKYKNKPVNPIKFMQIAKYVAEDKDKSSTMDSKSATSPE